MDKDKLLATLNLYRRLPASRLRQNVSALANLRPELQDEILRRVEQPLEVLTDEKNGQQYLKSEYNRDGDSYRCSLSINHHKHFLTAFSLCLGLHIQMNTILRSTSLFCQAHLSERWSRKQWFFLENTYICK